MGVRAVLPLFSRPFIVENMAYRYKQTDNTDAPEKVSAYPRVSWDEADTLNGTDACGRPVDVEKPESVIITDGDGTKALFDDGQYYSVDGAVEVRDLETRVTTLETETAQNTADIATLQTSVGSVETLTEKVDAVTAEVSTLSDAVEVVTSTTAELEGKVTSEAEQLSGISDDVSDLKTQTAQNTADIAQNTADIAALVAGGGSGGSGADGLSQVLLETNYDTETADVYQLTQSDGDEVKVLDNVQLTFTPLSPLTLTTPEAIGDIAQGTTAAELNGKPLSELFDAILFKTIYPTITAQSGTCKFASGYTSGTIKEAGLALPTDANMGYTYSQGSVVVDDGVSTAQSYTGAVVEVEYQETYSPGAANTNAGVASGGTAYTAQALSGGVMSVGTYTYRAVISYAEGALMKTSKGNTPNPMTTSSGGSVTNPCPAGTLTTSYNVNIPVSLPVWIDPASGTLTKQTLKTWGAMTFSGVSMYAQTAAAPSVIKTPRKINTLKSYYSVSGKYDVDQKSNYTMTTEVIDVNGVDVTYYVYTYSGGALSAVSFEIVTY